MKTIFIYFVIFSLTLLTSCLSFKKNSLDNYYLYQIPPGEIKVTENLYCDRTEVSNIAWREYRSWVKKIYGQESVEYILTLPDTSVWLNTYHCLYSCASTYFTHPFFDNYPVVGITQLQAEGFSKWRSDRVFEGLLYEYKVIAFDTSQTKKNHFTIEKYFSGEIKKLNSDKKALFYPEFRLPNLTERQFILKYADSTSYHNCDFNNSKSYEEAIANKTIIWSNISPCVNDTLTIIPSRITIPRYHTKDSKLLYNIRGNVAEWASEPNIAFGGS
jgi:hypothetical protein